MNAIVRVNLTNEKITIGKLNNGFLKKYVGGIGFGARILYDEVPFWVDAFDPENLLIFCTGPVTGTLTPNAARYTVVTKSPLTGLFGEANSGGMWGPALKAAGYDMIVITGRSRKPVYLFVSEDSVEIRDASAYWGANARETDIMLRKDLGDKNVRVACIGQAGENLVRFAAIMNDEAHRAAARCGVGAVMGYKKLKAIALSGAKDIPVADPERLKSIYEEVRKHINEHPSKSFFSKGGTPRLVSTAWELGDLPAFNWSSKEFGGPEDPWIEELSYPGGYEKVLVGRRSCHVCPTGCRRVVSFTFDEYTAEKVEGPEYETLGAIGTNCGLHDVRAVAAANDLCNKYGIDTISLGGTLAFAMECFEKGLIGPKDTDEIDLRFGNAEAVIEMIHKIAFRKGFGDILAEGSRRAARIIGGEAEKYAIQVKGLEMPMHDPRAFQGGGPHYAASPTGGRHTEGITLGIETSLPRPALGFPKVLDRYSVERKGEAAKVIEDWWTAISAMGFCIFGDVPWSYPSEQLMLETYEAVTGNAMSLEEALLLGERIYNLKRAFDIKHGLTGRDDTLPERLLRSTTKSGVTARLDKTLPQYYDARGWDHQTGKPKKETLIRLGLEDVAQDLWQ